MSRLDVSTPTGATRFSRIGSTNLQLTHMAEPQFHLFLDDERVPSDVTWLSLPDGPWVIVRTVQEFRDVICARGFPDFISFDNDLGTQEEGKHAAAWLVERCLDSARDIPAVAIHSKNNQAAEQIASLFRSYSRFRSSNGSSASGS